MGVPGSANPLLLAAAQDTGYNVSRSLRFNAPDSAYLSRTPGSAGNRKWTWSGWVKRSALGAKQYLFKAGVPGSTDDGLLFTSSDTLQAYTYSGGGFTSNLISTQVFRDCSAWYHIVWTWDTDNGTAAQRSRLYVNGQEITAFGTSSYPSSGLQPSFNNNVGHSIGSESPNALANYLSGYLAEIHFIDGQALTPSSFAETNATTGQWVPKAYTGSYGTNGFKLTFSDNSNTTSATLGKDTSGNNNDWSPTNFSVAAGAGNDSLVDTPTSYGTDTGVGGEVRGNYATLNPLSNSYPNLSNGNLDSGPWSDNGWNRNVSSIVVNTGKWYFEATIGNATDGSFRNGIGIQVNPVSTSASKYLGDSSDSYGGLAKSAGITGYTNAGAGTSLSNALSSGSVLRCAIDVDAGKVWIGDSTAYIGGGSPASGTSPTYTFAANSNVALGVSTWGSGDVTSVNCGQRAFSSTAPSGFKALCDTNLPAPVVAKPSTVFDTKLYTGNGSTQTISGLEFSPDLVWIKCRNANESHVWTDKIRGDGNLLFSNSTSAEAATSRTALGSNAFTVTDDASSLVNELNQTYVGWAWDAGSSNAATNTSGTITSTVKTSISSGCSVVTYTGNGSSGASIGHGLNAVPSFIVGKQRSATNDWVVFHAAVGNTSALFLNLTSTPTASALYWNNTSPSSTVFTVGSGTGLNQNNGTYVAYCFAPVAGFSAFGSYTGNGSADGPVQWCGFRPRWIMIKCSSAAGEHWEIMDSARAGYNFQNNLLYANLSNAEEANTAVLRADILSNGFKIRSSNSGVNANTATYVWAAFAESPFQYARAR